MTVGELLMTVVAIVIVVTGGVWLYAWWQARNDSRGGGPRNGEWPP